MGRGSGNSCRKNTDFFIVYFEAFGCVNSNENYIGFQHFCQNLELVSDFEWIDLQDVGSDWPRNFSGVKIVSYIVWKNLFWSIRMLQNTHEKSPSFFSTAITGSSAHLAGARELVLLRPGMMREGTRKYFCASGITKTIRCSQILWYQILNQMNFLASTKKNMIIWWSNNRLPIQLLLSSELGPFEDSN